jgi:hypothetical protein
MPNQLINFRLKSAQLKEGDSITIIGRSPHPGGACRFLLLKDGKISILEGFSYPK